MEIDKPQYLYKLCSARRAIQILRDRSLYLCPPIRLNDMYEGSMQHLLQYTPELAFELRWRQIRAHTGWAEAEAKEFVREDDDPQEIKDHFDQTAARLKALNLAVRRHSGVACFTARRDDQRMWGTYGDNHRGACIEFHNHGQDSLIARRCLPVLYSNRAEHEQLPDLIREDGSFDTHYFGLLCYLRKSLDWRDEREWRMLMLANTAQDAQARTVPFDVRDVRRVFLGPRIAAAHAAAIEALCEGRWNSFGLRSDPALGTTALEGAERIHSSEDLAYWVPAVRALLK